MITISGKSIVVTSQEGESNKIMLPADSDNCLERVIVMVSRPERTDGDEEDATGYPLVEEDPIAYMKSTVYNMCDGFETGVITKITAKSIEVNGTKRTFERVVVINW